MTAPTVAVTVRLADFGGPARAGIKVTARLSNVDYTADGVFISTDPVTATTDATGLAVLNMFPNAVSPAGLGTVGTTIRFTASMPGSRSLKVEAVIPNVACNLVDHVVDQEPEGLGGAERAAASAQAARDQAIAAAASTDADVIATAADRLQTGQDRVQTGADRIATGQDRTQTTLDRISTAASSAQASNYAAVAATGAKFFDTIALGRAGVADGATFGVKAGGSDALVRPTVYRRDSATTNTLLYQVLPGAEFDAVLPDQVGSESGLAFAVVDASGHRTWIEAGLDGAPTAYAVSKIGGLLTLANMPALGSAGQADISDENQLAYVVTDANGLKTEIEIGRDGKFTPRVVASLATRITGSSQGASGPDIACPGDSLTAGTGAVISYPAALATLTGRTVWNLGVGGETSATIAGRAGARPWRATVSGGIIPTSGGVTVTLTSDDGTAVSPLLQGSAGINPCVIAGVTGTLSLASGVYTFTRSANGTAVPVSFPAAVLTDAWTNRRSDIYIMWWGQNDGVNDATDIIARQRATIEGLKATDKRWLVVGLSTSSATFRAPMETQFYREFGRRFVNIREYLSSAAAMADAGLTPTTADLSDMANGAVPGSLRSDPTHLNDAGYARVAFFISQRLLELGFI